MAINLALTSQKDSDGNAAVFMMVSYFQDSEVSYGLGAQIRQFHTTVDLIQALEPTQLALGFLEERANELERGNNCLLELTEEQAWNIGMLPHRDGSQWVRTTISKVRMGDGSFRFCETYQVDDRTINGAALEELPELETRVRNYVALDWKTIKEELARRDTWNVVQHLPVETVRYIFDGEL